MRFPRNEVAVATRNAGKTKEFARMFGQIGIEVHDLNHYADLPEIIEDGDTFAANAEKKARTIARALGVPVLADDSGLCVEALNGEPGVFSARYAGPGATDEANNARLLARLRSLGAEVQPVEAAIAGGQHPRCLSRASFVCVLALTDPDENRTLFAEGTCPGYIVGEPAGSGGFGYDPLFYLPAFGKTMAELTTEQKNGISHRGVALRKLLDLLT